MLKRLFTHKLTYFLLAGLLLTTAFVAIPSNTAFAQEEAPDHNPGQNIDWRLERAYGRLQQASTKLQERLGRANEIIGKGEEWIAKLQDAGIYTAVLEDALDSYRTSVASAQSKADNGTQILADHAGFDDDGNVTDRETAVDTLRDAGRALQDGHRQLHDASITLRRIVRDFRRDHRGEFNQDQ